MNKASLTNQELLTEITFLKQKIREMEQTRDCRKVYSIPPEREEQIRRSEERYRDILDNMEEAYYEVDLHGDMTFFNMTAVTNLGYTDNEMMGMNFREYVDSETAEKLFQAYSRVFITGESVKGIDWELISKSGDKIPIESSISLIWDSDGKPAGFRGVIRDITERKRTEEALRESEMRFRNLTETAEDVIITTDLKGTITYANPAARTIASDLDLIGMALTDFLPPHIPVKQESTPASATPDYSAPVSFESKIMKPHDRQPLYFEIKSSVLYTRGEPSGALFVARDSTERKRTEEEIRMMAIIDALTGLYNRRGFIHLAEQQMKVTARNDSRLLLFFIDLDGLKFINDNHGHEEGDRALKKTAYILKKTFRESDIIARLGGDEFAILVSDGPELPEIALKRLKNCTDIENAASGLPYRIEMSTGVADYDPAVPCSIHELMSRADQMMYAQKRKKKNNE